METCLVKQNVPEKGLKVRMSDAGHLGLVKNRASNQMELDIGEIRMFMMERSGKNK